MRIGEFLDQLAAKAPTPGGGASAAIHAAQGAALVAMVGRFSDGPRYARDAPTISRIVADADRLRSIALHIVEDDITAFGFVAEAYRMPKDKRAVVMADALANAARPPAALVSVVSEILTLAEELLPIGNRNVITDIAAAADALRAAATTARVNIEINLRGITSSELRAECVEALDLVPSIIDRADAVVFSVRQELAS